VGDPLRHFEEAVVFLIRSDREAARIELASIDRLAEPRTDDWHGLSDRLRELKRAVDAMGEADTIK
jgi:hypothetical protein